MEYGGSVGPRAPRYSGEDTRETSEREIRGWYCYGLAAEVFAVCGVGSFLPVTLEQLARERGVWFSDRTTSCMVKITDQTGTAPGALLSRAANEENNQCIIHIFGGEMTTASFAMYTFSLAVLVQALSLISFSSVADYGNYRKKFLLGFGFTGATTSMLFILVDPKIYLVGPLLVIIGVTCLGSSIVILNSFLPLLVLNHPFVPDKATNPSSVRLEPMSTSASDDDPSHCESNHLQKSILTKSDSAQLSLQNKISSKGVGIGYCAAVLVQLLSILILYLMSKTSASSTLPLRIVLVMVGLWWFCFTVPVSIWMRSRPGPPLPAVLSKTSRFHTILAYLSFAWGSVWKTVKVAVKLREMAIFLVAWFILSDAVATVSGTAVLFARTELKMGTVPIAILSITAMSSGIAGAFFWPIISRRFKLQTNRTIFCCIALMEIIPLYGLMGYLPFIKSWGVGGLQKAWEIYPLGFVHGFIMGGLSSYCRSFYGLLIPPGSEAAFYALYAITDKGSSAVGPAVVGLIVDATGTIRPAFFFLAILIALPLPLIWVVDVEKGKEDAARMAGLIKKSASSNEASDEQGDEEAEGLMRNHE